jgi:hypothetical protein
MTTKQPLALELADWLDGEQFIKSANEMRRLYAENENFRKHYVTQTAYDFVKEEVAALKSENEALRTAIQAALSETGDSGWELYFQSEIIRNGLKATITQAGEKT